MLPQPSSNQMNNLDANLVRVSNRDLNRRCVYGHLRSYFAPGPKTRMTAMMSNSQSANFVSGHRKDQCIRKTSLGTGVVLFRAPRRTKSCVAENIDRLFKLS